MEDLVFSSLNRFTVDGDYFLFSCSVLGRDATFVYFRFLLSRVECLVSFLPLLGAGIGGNFDATGDRTVWDVWHTWLTGSVLGTGTNSSSELLVSSIFCSGGDFMGASIPTFSAVGRNAERGGSAPSSSFPISLRLFYVRWKLRRF